MMTFPEISNYIRREHSFSDDWHAREVFEWSSRGHSFVRITGFVTQGVQVATFDMPLTQYREIVGTPLA